MNNQEKFARNKRIYDLAMGRVRSFHPWSHADIGREFGVSRWRIAQIVKKMAAKEEKQHGNN